MPDSEFEDIGADAIDPTAKWDKYHLWFDKSKDRFLWKKPDGSWSAKKKDLINIELGTQYGLSDLAERDEKGQVIDEKSELDYLLGHAMTYKEVKFTLGGTIWTRSRNRDNRRRRLLLDRKIGSVGKAGKGRMGSNKDFSQSIVWRGATRVHTWLAGLQCALLLRKKPTQQCLL